MECVRAQRLVQHALQVSLITQAHNFVQVIAQLVSIILLQVLAAVVLLIALLALMALTVLHAAQVISLILLVEHALHLARQDNI